MCTTVYFYFFICYSMLTTKNLVSIHHYTVDPFTHFPLPPPLPLWKPLLCSLYLCVCFGLVCSFILFFCLFICFLYSTYEWNHLVFLLTFKHFTLSDCAMSLKKQGGESGLYSYSYNTTYSTAIWLELFSFN